MPPLPFLPRACLPSPEPRPPSSLGRRSRSSAVRRLPFLSSAPLARRRRKPRRGPCSLHRRAGHGSLHTRRQQWRARPPLSLPASFARPEAVTWSGGGGPELRRRWWAADPRPARPDPAAGDVDPAAGTTATGTRRRRLPFAPSLSGGASGGGARREARCAGRGGGARHQRRPLPDPVFFWFFFHTNFF